MNPKLISTKTSKGPQQPIPEEKLLMLDIRQRIKGQFYNNQATMITAMMGVIVIHTTSL